MSTLPYATSVLTQEQSMHGQSNTKMIIEVGLYLLIRNTIYRWSRNPTTEVKRIEDDGMGRHQYQESHWFSFL